MVLAQFSSYLELALGTYIFIRFLLGMSGFTKFVDSLTKLYLNLLDFSSQQFVILKAYIWVLVAT